MSTNSPTLRKIFLLFCLSLLLTPSSVGDPPYDQVTNFAKGPYNETVLYCEGVGAQIVCNQKKKTTVYAPIYATIA